MSDLSHEAIDAPNIMKGPLSLDELQPRSGQANVFYVAFLRSRPWPEILNANRQGFERFGPFATDDVQFSVRTGTPNFVAHDQHDPVLLPLNFVLDLFTVGGRQERRRSSVLA